ncbi:carbamoyl-phosphate synthase domain-containing protein [uncultured Tessaracoccus sp.]|uniref:carbamoyl-phosphate synthase domain-containing protein n=1 Tax=uncultured Tessaracoccus sp. TaxID=905023 RepID=UPI00262064D2|nr:carbamoyl-phosphate synthase domain-containing protein [uncultured Tessaracoccus sp.]
MHPAYLVLEDGRTFRGSSFGRDREVYGTLRACTAMVGYQEALTDPDAAGSILVFTTPHIGNTGWNDEDSRSDRIQVSAVVMRDKAPKPSNFRSTQSLDEALLADDIVALTGIDTRALMRHLSDHGPLWAAVTTRTDTDAVMAELRARKDA